MYYLLCELPNGTMAIVEPAEEVLAYMLKSDREWENAERREREHVKFHIDGMAYEGLDLSDRETPEDLILKNEEVSQINKKLTVLTKVQYRRVIMRLSGMTIREIAEAEETSVNAVEESLMQARKKLEKTREIF